MRESVLSYSLRGLQQRRLRGLTPLRGLTDPISISTPLRLGSTMTASPVSIATSSAGARLVVPERPTPVWPGAAPGTRFDPGGGPAVSPVPAPEPGYTADEEPDAVVVPGPEEAAPRSAGATLSLWGRYKWWVLSFLVLGTGAGIWMVSRRAVRRR